MNENGHPTGPDEETVLEDRVELALRERITVLEDHADKLNTALGLLCIAFVALVVSHFALMAIVRKARP